MNSRRNKIILIIVLLFIIVFVLVPFIYLKSHRKARPQSTSFNPNPSQEVIAVITQYVQAREDAVGADQSSPTSWIDSVKPITTPAWFTSLQPKPEDHIPLGEYNLAHDNGYLVQTKLGQCTWNLKNGVPTDSAGSVTCPLTDVTVNKSTRSTLTGSALPFGWTRTDQQAPVELDLVKQNGKWLVNDDSSGEID